MSAYDTVQRGALKLKGVSKKKKKSSKRKESMDERAEAAFEQEDAGVEVVRDTMTEAEKKFNRIKEQRDKKKIAEAAKTSYREQVEGFNKKLAEEPEHFDTPKVSHTK